MKGKIDSKTLQTRRDEIRELLEKIPGGFGDYRMAYIFKAALIAAAQTAPHDMVRKTMPSTACVFGTRGKLSENFNADFYKNVFARLSELIEGDGI